MISAKSKGKARKRTRSLRRHGKNNSSAERKPEEKRSSPVRDKRSSSHRTEPRTRRRSRARARSLFRKPSSPKRHCEIKSLQTHHSETSARERRRSRNRDRSRRNRARATAEKDKLSGKRRAVHYDQSRRRRHSDRRDSHSLRTTTPVALKMLEAWITKRKTH